MPLLDTPTARALCSCLLALTVSQTTSTFGNAFAQASTDEQRRKALLLGIAVEDDADLRKQRALCDQGRMPSFRHAMEESGTPFPDVHIYCRTVLHEEGLRGRINTYRLNREATAIYSAARAQQLVYENIDGVERALPCETSYDVGYQIGWQKPDWSFQSKLISQAEDNAAACFENGATHPTLAFVAGVHHGQADRKRPT